MNLKRASAIIALLSTVFVVVVAALLSGQIRPGSFVNDEINVASSPTNDLSLTIEQNSQIEVSSAPVGLLGQNYYVFSFPKVEIPDLAQIINTSLKVTSFTYQTASLKWDIFALPGNPDITEESLISSLINTETAKISLDRTVQYYPAGLDIYLDLTLLDASLWQDSVTIVIKPTSSSSEGLVIHAGSTGEVYAPRLVLTFTTGEVSSSTSTTTTSISSSTATTTSSMTTTSQSSSSQSSVSTTTAAPTSRSSSSRPSGGGFRSSSSSFTVTTTATTTQSRSTCLGDYNGKPDSSGVVVDNDDLAKFGDLYTRTLTGNEIYLYDLTAGDSVSDKLTLSDLAIFAANYNRANCVISRN